MNSLRIFGKTRFNNVNKLNNRSLFYWIYIQFNLVDQERREKFGADRTCAEWILRNGGAIRWVGSDKILSDYNALPEEGNEFYLEDVDGSKTSITHHGFEHFNGCKHVKKVVLDECYYLEDTALSKLSYIKNSLKFLQLSNCANITDQGLLSIEELKNLKELRIERLPGVKNTNSVISVLQKSMPSCKIVLQ